MPDATIIRSSLMLLMMGALGLLSVQQVWVWKSRRGQTLHLWAALWSVNALVFVLGRLIQQAGQTQAASNVGTRIQFVCGFATGVVAYGLLTALRKKPGSSAPLVLITISSVSLGILVVATNWLLLGTGTLRVEATGSSYYAMSPGPYMWCLGPYTILTVGYAIVLARQSEFGRATERTVLGVLAIVIGLTMLNDMATLMGLFRGLQMLDVGFFVVAVGAGYVVEREGEYRHEGMRRDLRSSREELERSEARFRLLAETTAEGIAIHSDGRVLHCNRSLAQMTGYGPEGQWELHSLWLPADQEKSARALRAECETPVELAVRRADGSTFPATLIGGSASLHGQEVGVLALRDLTERRHLESQLIFADRIATLGRVAAGVGHEINNPLTCVLANVQFMKDDLDTLPLTEEQRASADTLLDAATEGCERIEAIARDLALLSRKPEDEEQTADVSAALDSSIRFARAEILPRAQIVKDYAALPPAHIAPRKLGQVALNLLVNAAHAIDPGDAKENQITVRTRLDGEQIAIEIRDTGAGMAQDVAERIFEPFFTTKAVGEGTGLGLSICHSIVTSAAGEISVDSTPGVGTSFHVRLPVASVATPPEEPVRPKTPTGQTKAAVLVVDDDPLIARVIGRLLEEHIVTIALRGPEAVERCLHDRPDLILCDLVMPEMGGDEVYAQVHERDPELAARFVFMTGGVFRPETRAFLDGITNRVINKPLTQDQLNELARAAIRPVE